jgi:hypothetical protein
MLAAILTAGDKAWFFKIVGPAAELDTRVDELQEFFASLRPAVGTALPTWKLPSDWSTQPASGMRAATILVPIASKSLELTVTSLPWTGAPGEILSNVNRWRGQLQLDPTDEEGLGRDVRTIEREGTKITVVDLRGRLVVGGQMPPFADAAGVQRLPDASAEKKSTGQNELPPGHPPIDGRSTTPSTGASPVTFKIPLGWTELPASGMRKAAFGIADGERRALVTVIDFPIDAGPMMGDPLENVNRWRREVGLDPLTQDALDANTSILQVDGLEARYMEAIPDAATPAESLTSRATLAAMVPKGDQMWFVKLTGDRQLVVRERDSFHEFLATLQFSSPGLTHGN